MFMDTNEQGFNHYCKICKKGFGCGRALGGHMRAHGIISDDNNNVQFTDDEDNNNNNNKRMYALRANPNRLKNCRSCGKDFSSWKSFLEHGRCGGEDPEEEEEEEEEGSLVSGYASDEEDRLRWSKGKRSRRTKAVSGVVDGPSEEEDLAYCLLMLSTAAAAAASAAANVGPSTGVVAETEESCASASRDEDNQHHPNRAVIAAPPITIGLIEWPVPRPGPGPSSSGGPRGVFECKACKKVFTSHQALGGHRASHKKVKGCFAARLDESARQEDPGGGGDAREEERMSSMKSAIVLYEAEAGKSAHAHAQGRKAKVHECSICHRVFASGQALGGHKRCHWITSNSIEVGARERPPREVGASNVRLDLNLPAPEEIFGQQAPWIGLRTSMENNTSEFDNNNETLIYNNLNNNVDDDDDNNVNYSRRDNGGEEAESKAKVARLSELKELSLGGGGGGGGGVGGDWLQVGIGSSGNGSCDP